MPSSQLLTASYGKNAFNKKSSYESKNDS